LPHGSDPHGVEGLHAELDEVIQQIDAHGTALKHLYLLGLEPTLNPEVASGILDYANRRGISAVAASNAYGGIDNFLKSFETAVDRGQLSRINVSIDSMNSRIHDALRGQDGALRRTLDTIKKAIEMNYPIQITMTVWAENYHTIIESVRALYDLGVRGFAFHEGSLESVQNWRSLTSNRISPLAWRALVSKLEVLKAEFSRDSSMQHFIFPYIYFTEHELRTGIIGDDDLTGQYLQHLDDLEAGRSSELPFNACPGVDVPQVYVFSHFGSDRNSVVSLCNMHTIGTGAYFASFDESEGKFKVVEDPDRNQRASMARDVNLCPARPYVERDSTTSCSDKKTYLIGGGGSLYHACRYISSEQFSDPERDFGSHYYEDFRFYYQLRFFT